MSKTDGQTETKHTPGPWEWDWRYDADRAEADCGVFTQGRSIGLGHAYAVARCPRYQTQAKWEADARLIAAAPDLLAALKAWQALESEPFNFDDQRYRDLFKRARALTSAALALAEPSST